MKEKRTATLVAPEDLSEITAPGCDAPRDQDATRHTGVPDGADRDSASGAVSYARPAVLTESAPEAAPMPAPGPAHGPADRAPGGGDEGRIFPTRSVLRGGVSRLAGSVLTSVLFLAAAPLVRAASSFGDMADNVKNELSRFGPLLQAGFALGGFFLVGLGLWQLWARSQQPGQPKGGAIVAILIGCGLLGAATIAQMGSGTLGTGSPELGEIGL